MNRRCAVASVTIGFDVHDHTTCVSDAVNRAAAHCASQGLRFTPVRRRVLELLLKHHRALGAYEILDVLREEGLGSQPPVAYRALEFLTEHGFAHRIEAINAFTACHHTHRDHDAAFLICTGCGLVAETAIDPGRDALDSAAQASGFSINRMVMEAQGLCPACQD